MLGESFNPKHCHGDRPHGNVVLVVILVVSIRRRKIRRVEEMVGVTHRQRYKLVFHSARMAATEIRLS